MNHLYAQINVKPDTPAKAIAAQLTDLLTDGLYEHLKNHPDLIQKKRDPVSRLDVCSVKLIFVRHHIEPAERGKRICACPPDVHPEDAWAESERNLNCPACCGSGHVDDVTAPVRNMQNALKLCLEFMNDIGEQTFFHGGWPAVERLNEARDAIKAALGMEQRFGVCTHCHTPMQLGVAIEQTCTAGEPDFPSDRNDPNAIVTLSPGGPGKLIDCLKCPKCGWSVTNGGAE